MFESGGDLIGSCIVTNVSLIFSLQKIFNGKRKSGSWEEYKKKMSTKRVKGSAKAKKTPEFITVQQMGSEPTKQKVFAFRHQGLCRFF